VILCPSNTGKVTGLLADKQSSKGWEAKPTQRRRIPSWIFWTGVQVGPVFPTGFRRPNQGAGRISINDVPPPPGFGCNQQ
jgi:hypothetical protein